MDGLANVAGAAAEFRVGDVVYYLEPFTIGHWSEMERHLEARRPNPYAILAAALPMIPAEERGAFIRETTERAANAKAITLEDAINFLQTFDGIAFAIWCAARTRQPTTCGTLAQVVAILTALQQVRLIELEQIVLRITGMEALGKALKNLPSPTQETETETVRIREESRGPASSAT